MAEMVLDEITENGVKIQGAGLEIVYDKNGIFLNKALIDQGYAVPYFGGPRGL
jgi:endonuclease YncB( thermonuclease family)